MFTEHNKTIIIYMKQFKDTQYKGKSGKKTKSEIIISCFFLEDTERVFFKLSGIRTDFSRLFWSVIAEFNADPGKQNL